MATYDSDSSDGEYTETNVLLGYASKDGAGETISRLGGRPEWMDSEKPPSAALAKCKVCKDMMVLLLQLNAELPEKFPGHDRRIYVFACRRATCQRKEGSICAVRGMRVWKEVEKEEMKVEEDEKKDEAVKEKKGGQALGETLFGATTFGGGPSNSPFANSANPFSSSSSTAPSNPFASAAPANPFSAPAKPASPEPTPSLSKTFAETLSLNAPPTSPPPPQEPWPADDSLLPNPYPTLYLDEADYETLDPVSTAVPASATMEGADAPEPSILDREAFESAMDGTFQKFADRMSQNPEQVIRYEFGGQPLLYAKNDSVGQMLLGNRGGMLPGCGNCGARRVFEVQLTPRAIMELEADDMGLEGMEWGTVLVGVCEVDCVARGVEGDEAGYLREWVGVQWEELAKGN